MIRFISNDTRCFKCSLRLVFLLVICLFEKERERESARDRDREKIHKSMYIDTSRLGLCCKI